MCGLFNKPFQTQDNPRIKYGHNNFYSSRGFDFKLIHGQSKTNSISYYMLIPVIEFVYVGYVTKFQDDIVQLESPITDDSEIIGSD